MKREKRFFKGFTPELKTHSYNQQQYAIGEIFKAGDTSKKPATCSNSVIHFCDSLAKTFSYYSRNGKHRFCEVKVLPGQPIVSDGNDKLGSPYIEIVREIPGPVVDRYHRFVTRLQAREAILKNHRLDLIKTLQSRYPELILCGSAAVFLHTGKVYARNEHSKIHDLDFVVPYYIKIEGEGVKKKTITPETIYENVTEYAKTLRKTQTLNLSVSKTDKWGSGNDFDECIYVNNVPCDLAINPHQKFEYITFQGFRFKVATLPSILEHKLKYANQGSNKHMQDIQDLIDLPVSVKIK